MKIVNGNIKYESGDVVSFIKDGKLRMGIVKDYFPSAINNSIFNTYHVEVAGGRLLSIKEKFIEDPFVDIVCKIAQLSEI